MQTILAAGAFGDGATTVSVLQAPGGAGGPVCPRIVLLHGVHGCASPEPENKYGYLARLCTERGSDACIVETSRARRDRNTFIREDGGDDRVAWAIAAFSGKTFAMELSDVCAALERIEADLPPRPTVLWGFSLGGIIAVLIAGGAHERLLNEAGLRAPRVNAAFLGAATSGSGDRIRREAEGRLALPILDSVPPPGTLHRAAENMRTEFFLSFYGDRDTSFDEASVRRIFDLAAVPGGQKVFSVLGGSDHAFRTVNGAPSFRPLIGMADSVVSFSARAIRERSR